MPRKLISSGSKFEAEVGYSRAVVDGDFVFVSGTTGYDYAKMTLVDDVVQQCEQTLKNIDAALTQAGASMKDVVRATYIFPTPSDFKLCWPVLQKWFGDVRPAATMFSAALVDPKMKVEIEVTAKLSR